MSPPISQKFTFPMPPTCFPMFQGQEFQVQNLGLVFLGFLFLGLWWLFVSRVFPQLRRALLLLYAHRTQKARIFLETIRDPRPDLLSPPSRRQLPRKSPHLRVPTRKWTEGWGGQGSGIFFCFSPSGVPANGGLRVGFPVFFPLGPSRSFFVFIFFSVSKPRFITLVIRRLLLVRVPGTLF